MALTPKQLLFVAEYIIDFNASLAAQRAGYSKRASGNQGYQNLMRPEIQAAITNELKQRERRTHISQDRVLQELAAIAFFDPRKLFNPDGSPIPINELDDSTAAALAGLDVQEEFEGSGADRVFVGYTKKYKVSDKNTALANAMRHLGMLRDKVEITGEDGGPVAMNLTASQQLLQNLKGKLNAAKR
jgi:phage terminase small subunit